jgi:cytoskeletal protein RodZ
MSERTKLSRQHIEAVEAERFAELPVAVYLRGIVMCIARELRLDGQKVSRSYLERAAGASKTTR